MNPKSSIAAGMLAVCALMCGAVSAQQQVKVPVAPVPTPAQPSVPAAQTVPGQASQDGQVVLDPEKQILVEGQPRPLTGFQSNYQVYRKGDLMGTAMMQVVRLGPTRWRVDLGIRGTKGIAGFASLNSQQSTVFDQVGTQYVPVSQSTFLTTLLSSNKVTGVYDWNTKQARWTGDIKKSRQLPVALQPGDMSMLLVNLALVRDARPGLTLNYRLVDRGRARPINFAVSPVQEVVKTGEDSFQALAAKRINVGGDQSLTVWVSEGVSTPVRMVLVQDDVGELDLQLATYKVIQ